MKNLQRFFSFSEAVSFVSLKIQLTHKFMYYTNIIYDDDGWKYCRRMKMKTSEKTELKSF